MDLADASRLDFVLTLRRRWADTLYPALADQVEATGKAAASAAETLPLHDWFAWLERGSQKML